ncbi:MAG TPA: serine/threonine-protein kinase [Candidatus Krumholzibacteria bacterium]|nr:serine/threonine-protein kinase [Candidatus Krumholzibacteria bacterium]
MTLVRPDASTRRDAATPSGFPSDLFEQARGRLRLLVTFFIIAFGFDLVIFAGTWLYVKFTGGTIPADGNRIPAAQWINLGAVVTSVALWWAAGSRRVSASRLHTWGLTYEVIICFICSLLPYWQYYIDHQLIPQLTWVPAIVIMFPLIMPGPPRRMLMAAVASAAMAPFALLVLQLTGRVDLVDGSPYVPATVGSAFAVGFAYVGARVVYGLGREVARARALGSYQLEEQLGAGGMGEVWRARHRLLARPAAIKLIRPSLAGSTSAVVSEEARRRFEREAQAIAGLRSPHTVHLFDFGIADDGAFYYAMELLEGLDADALVRRFGPIPAERAVHLLRQVCHSLSEAESRGLVHRDVKPSNIFVCRYGEDHDFVKVLDFGIVKTRDDTTETPDPLTSEAVIRGTPAFMAPEQALGAAELDGRADIYAVGCVAYWLLTGQMVFAADSRAALLMHHIQTVPVAPSARTELPVPAELDEVVLACLAKDPAARPQSARELSVRLDELKLEAWTEARAREWWERHRPDERAAS